MQRKKRMIIPVKPPNTNYCASECTLAPQSANHMTVFVPIPESSQYNFSKNNTKRPSGNFPVSKISVQNSVSQVLLVKLCAINQLMDQVQGEFYESGTSHRPNRRAMSAT